VVLFRAVQTLMTAGELDAASCDAAAKKHGSFIFCVPGS
jgi:hypothetical protein